MIPAMSIQSGTEISELRRMGNWPSDWIRRTNGGAFRSRFRTMKRLWLNFALRKRYSSGMD